MSESPETDKAERMAFSQEYMVPTEFARKIEMERDHYKEAILSCLEKNRHLADGDNCTLILLKKAILHYGENNRVP
jgi:hypothetical protein